MLSKTYIVIGGTPQGLAIVRVLGRANVALHVLCQSKKNVAYHTRFGIKHLFSNPSDLKNIVAEIVATSEVKPICYIASGEALALILRTFVEIYDMCEVFSQPLSLIQKWAHKDLMYRHAAECGFQVANHVTLDKYTPGDLAFPIVLKRNYEIPLFFKVAYVADEHELAEYVEKIPPQCRQDILVQERIQIDTANLLEISCQGYFAQGQAHGFLIANQLRRASKGLTSYIEEIDDCDVKSMVEKLAAGFMAGTGYTGFAEFEFMYDKSSGINYFIEVNTRTCGLQSSMSSKFENITDVVLNPDQGIDLIARPGLLRWMNIGRDMKVRLQKKDFKRLGDVFHSSYDILDFNDLNPFIRQFI